jgi:hypothetical protein
MPTIAGKFSPIRALLQAERGASTPRPSSKTTMSLSDEEIRALQFVMTLLVDEDLIESKELPLIYRRQTATANWREFFADGFRKSRMSGWG